MMKQIQPFLYAESEGHQATEPRYDGEGPSVVIFLPEAGQFKLLKSVYRPSESVTLQAVCDTLKSNSGCPGLNLTQNSA